MNSALRSVSSSSFLSALSLFALTHCGGGQEASSPKGARSSAPEAGETAGDDSSDPSGAEAPADQTDPCAETGCFSCGEGTCPRGSYCDESKPSPACSWVSDCGATPSCSCLTRILGAACSCEEGTGVRIRCGE